MLEQPLWTPSPIRVGQSNLACLMASLNKRHGVNLNSYRDIHAFSIDDPDAFWGAVWEYGRVRAESRGDTVVLNSGRMQEARYFPDARLNYAENLLTRRSHDDAGDALVFWGEDKAQRRMSHAELFATVSRATGALRALGVGPGDRVAAYMPNMPETIVALLATSAVGAIWSSASEASRFCASVRLSLGIFSASKRAGSNLALRSARMRSS